MDNSIPNPNLESLDEKNVSNGKSNKNIILVVLIVLVVGLGAFTGYYFSGKKLGGSKEGSGGIISQDKITKGVEFGVKDIGKADSATGVLEEGGIDGEGTHKLLREGGPSQTVYVISSVLDLDQFSGKKIQIWGDTQKAQKAGWLMDVIKVKILE